jgi:hypothetical protein
MDELYYGYLEGCRNYNELNALPEKGWEWHHILPQCLFGDQPLGLWLTKEQHAIASALQSLFFGVNCLCPWHVKHLPPKLWRACKPLFQSDKEKIGQKTFVNKVGCHAPGMANKGVQRAKELKVGALFASSNQLSQWGKIGGPKGGTSGLNADPEYIKKRSKKGGKKAATTLWMDPSHPELGHQNAGNLVRMQRKRGLPSGREHRVKVETGGD